MLKNILIPTDRSKLSHSVQRAAVAGTAGGAVEVLWIGVAAALLGVEGNAGIEAVVRADDGPGAERCGYPDQKAVFAAAKEATSCALNC